MAKLIYSAITSLDGYVADAAGNFDWAEPDPEVHRFINQLERQIGTYLYGRRMYEVMMAWEGVSRAGDAPEFVRDFAGIWQGADKIVFSKTLQSVSSRKTRIEREFNPKAIGEMKAAAAADITVGGPELAAEALRSGLVDELRLFLVPVLVGDGKRALSKTGQVALQLLDQRRFGSGTIHLQYQTNPPGKARPPV